MKTVSRRKVSSETGMEVRLCGSEHALGSAAQHRVPCEGLLQQGAHLCGHFGGSCSGGLGVVFSVRGVDDAP